MAPMADIRFINKNSTSVDIATVRKRFFELAAGAEVDLEFAMHVWDEAMQGQSQADTATVRR